MTTSERIKLLESKAVIFSAAGMADLAEVCYQRAARLANVETDTNEKALSVGHIIQAIAFLETARSYLGATMESGYYRDWMITTMGKHIGRLRDATDLTPE